jgi:hypothetical protein
MGDIAPSCLTSTLHGGEWSASPPGRFTPRCPLDKRLGGAESRSEQRGVENRYNFIQKYFLRDAFVYFKERKYVTMGH